MTVVPHRLKELADPVEVLTACLQSWRPPPRLSLSQWADKYFVLSAESAAEPGRWRTLPYQREIMDAFTDPRIEKITLRKSARIGYTKIINAAIGYTMHHDPCPVMVVQPTVEDAKGYSKEEIAPMISDTPVLQKIIFEEEEETGPRDSGNTILHKRFKGGVVSFCGANSGSGFRRVSRKRVFCDEVDAYPPSAGSDGDPIKLAAKRAEYYWDRKLMYGSTPLLEGTSRIDELFKEGDQRRYYVPCPTCKHMDYFVFTRGADGRGHQMRWPKDKPKEAYFECSKNSCRIEHASKRWMIERGEWRADAEFNGHASFHIWTAYSYAPGAAWGDIAAEFISAKARPETLRTFVNTTLGEVWREAGEAPDHERLYNRRENYPIGIVPEGVRFVTAGVDVQKDYWAYEVVGWGADRQSWSIDAGVIQGKHENVEDWKKLDEELLNKTWPTASGGTVSILALAVDSGAYTQDVYNWARGHAMSRVIATKGMATSKVLLGTPSPVDLLHNGRRISNGYKVWPLGSDIGKAELYGLLKLKHDPETPYPPGYCHFPEYGPEFFKQLTAEHLVAVKNKKGYTVQEWRPLPNRENHHLDTRILARAAASLAGLDRLAAQRAAQHAPKAPAAPTILKTEDRRPAPPPPPQQSAPSQDRRSPVQQPRLGSFMSPGGASNFRGRR